MLEMKECCKVPFPEKLFEEYEVKDTAIYANVNASKVVDMMKRFIFKSVLGKKMTTCMPLNQKCLLTLLSFALNKK